MGYISLLGDVLVIELSGATIEAIALLVASSFLISTRASSTYSLNFSNEFEFSDGWNGEYRVDGNKLVIRAKEYNGTIKAGESVSDIGFIVSAKRQLSL